jgi:hypothetical protein
MMPAQEPIIGPERARLAAAWVLAQSRGASSAAAGGAR